MKVQVPPLFYDHLLSELRSLRRSHDRVADALEHAASALERIAQVDERRIYLETSVGVRRSVVPHGMKVAQIEERR